MFRLVALLLTSGLLCRAVSVPLPACPINGSFTPPAPQSMTVDQQLQAELVDPRGFVFGWAASLSSFPPGCRGVRQTSYRLLLIDGDTNDTVWDTGAVGGNKSSMVPFGGPMLREDAVYMCVCSVIHLLYVCLPQSSRVSICGVRGCAVNV